MKKAFRFSVLLLCLCLLPVLCACGAESSAAPAAPETPSPLAQHAGEYTLFAISYGEWLVAPEALDFSSSLTLREDGTGLLSINEQSGPVQQWMLDGEQVVIESGVSTIEGTLKDGVAILDFDNDNLLYYALPGAELSAYSPLSLDELVALLAKDALGGAEIPPATELVPEEDPAQPTS